MSTTDLAVRRDNPVGAVHQTTMSDHLTLADTVLTRDAVVTAELAIRDLAATVVNQARNREIHPTYGNTKTTIRFAGQRLEGAICLYSVLTGQALHPMLTGIVLNYADKSTAERVAQARAALDTL